MTVEEPPALPVVEVVTEQPHDWRTALDRGIAAEVAKNDRLGWPCRCWCGCERRDKQLGPSSPMPWCWRCLVDDRHLEPDPPPSCPHCGGAL